MLMNIGIIVLILLFALGIAIATRPDTFRVERSATIAAPPRVVFGYLNDFRNWLQWSPWEKLDPDLKRTYSGAPSGVGSSYAWSGNNQAGQGFMLITESKPDDRITLDLNFLKPFKASNITQFTLSPNSAGTHLTWTMSGKHTTMTKAFSLVTSMDKLVGKDFEQGLANLKSLAEADVKRGATV